MCNSLPCKPLSTTMDTNHQPCAHSLTHSLIPSTHHPPLIISHRSLIAPYLCHIYTDIDSPTHARAHSLTRSLTHSLTPARTVCSVGGFRTVRRASTAPSTWCAAPPRHPWTAHTRARTERSSVSWCTTLSSPDPMTTGDVLIALTFANTCYM